MYDILPTKAQTPYEENTARKSSSWYRNQILAPNCARKKSSIRKLPTPWIVRHDVQLLINRNYNKIREEYDSALNYLTGLFIQLLSYMPKKKPFKCN